MLVLRKHKTEVNLGGEMVWEMKSVCVGVCGLRPNTRPYYMNLDRILLLGDSIMCWWTNF
jgi:hypothetical protein